MKIDFYKYQGTGNDFVLLDNRNDSFGKQDTKLIAKLCHRKFGIGGDGLILLENSAISDFKMIYFNADGYEGSMCGNGGRCIVAFAKKLKIIKNKTTFEAVDGLHHASIENDLVKLQMANVDFILGTDSHLFLDTGSPHHIRFENNITAINVKKIGAAIRYGKPYFKVGTNVNFVEQIGNDTFKVRTYERGVEDETLSCGTGVTAVALAAHKTNKTNQNLIHLETAGGKLAVSFKEEKNCYYDIFLIGKAIFVFNGEINF